MIETAFLQSEIPGLTPKQGKVRDVYDFGDVLLFIATDRISAYDWVMPNGIPGKGKILTAMSWDWFRWLDVPHHALHDDLSQLHLPNDIDVEPLRGRSMIVKKTQVFPVECVVRGYLSGSGWKEYQESQSVCGIKLPAGLKESDRLPEPIFTPATKAEEGHDENIPFETMVDIIGQEVAEELRRRSIEIYSKAAAKALEKGIIIADTKFEFGHLNDEILLIDEVLTPDSSRFWPADKYEPGKPQPSFDKQFVRDWLSSSGWDRNSPPPQLPDEIVSRTKELYTQAYERLFG